MSSSFYVRITGKWKQAKIRRFRTQNGRGQRIRGVHSDSFCASSFVTLRHVSVFERKKAIRSTCKLVARALHNGGNDDATRRNQRTTRRRTLGSLRACSCMFVHTRINSNAARKSDRFQRYARPDHLFAFERYVAREKSVALQSISIEERNTKRAKYFDENSHSGTKSIDQSFYLRNFSARVFETQRG